MASLEDRFWAKVDKSGPVSPVLGTRCWLWTAATVKGGYGNFRVSDKFITAHRFSWQLAHGAISSEVQVDHRCFNPPCVNPDHLRVVTHKQNMEHRSGAHSNSQSGIRGVTLLPNGKWWARIRHNKKLISLGRYTTSDEAVKAYKEAQDFYFTHHN